MSSKKRRTRRAVARARRPRTGNARPILWVGGSGPPGGALGQKVVSLASSLHWEPLSEDASRSAASLAPALVVIETERSTAALRTLLASLTELKQTTDLVVLQLRARQGSTRTAGFDGALYKGKSLPEQIDLALSVIAGSRTYKRSGERAKERVQQLKEQIERLKHLAVRDDLTDLYNLRFFNRTLETEHQRATRFGRNYALIFLDLDGLREVNNRSGHLAGGQVLKQVGEFLAAHVRRIDVPARIGGDEFVIVCPETGKPSARRVADRLRYGISKLQNASGQSLGITTSIGVASFPDDGDLPDEVLERADRALYEAKASGKNCVRCWGEFEFDQSAEFRGSVHGTSGSGSLSRLTPASATDLSEDGIDEADTYDDAAESDEKAKEPVGSRELG